MKREQPAITARQIAFRLLQEHDRSGEFLSQLITAPEYSGIPPQEKRLAVDMAETTLRRVFTVDRLLRQVMTRKQSETHPALWQILRLGVTQLFFMENIPEHAAIHETVELARFIDKPHITKLINGVLRNLQRMQVGRISYQANISNTAGFTLTNPEQPETPLEPMRLLPINDSTAWLVNQDLFPRPDLAASRVSTMATYLAETLSVPDWLVKDWMTEPSIDPVASFARARQRGLVFLDDPRLTLRVNPLKSTRDDYLTTLQQASIEAVAGDEPQAIRLIKNVSLADLPGYKDGVFSVQDETAQKVARLCDPKPHMHVLDLCAAPGSKTTHIAELMKDTGVIVACDIKPARLVRVRENATRQGFKSIQTQLIDRTSSQLAGRKFDRILIDAPCSNTGVLHKRPEVRGRLTPEDIRELSDLQADLLHRMLSHLKPGGKLIYSTCSLERDENDQLISSLLSSSSNYHLEHREQTEPTSHNDGGFVAVISER
jgi:16S rRNA (cytosine967-C5)-methyltransferase